MANDSIVSTRPSNALKGAPRHTLRRRPLRFPNKAAKYMAWILRLATNLWQSPWCGACPRGVAAQLWRSRGARGSHCTALPHSAGFTAARAGHHHARRSSCGPGGAYMNWIRELDMNIKTKDAKYTPYILFLGARYGSRWSSRRGKAAWRGRGRPAPRQGGRAGEAGRTRPLYCNERARPVCLFISGPTTSR